MHLLIDESDNVKGGDTLFFGKRNSINRYMSDHPCLSIPMKEMKPFLFFRRTSRQRPTTFQPAHATGPGGEDNVLASGIGADLFAVTCSRGVGYVLWVSLTVLKQSSENEMQDPTQAKLKGFT